MRLTNARIIIIFILKHETQNPKIVKQDKICKSFVVDTTSKGRTFSPHAGLETLLEAAVLALVAMMLVDRTVAVAAARVRQVASHGALEETLASLARELPVVLAGALVSADDALDARLLGVVDRRGAGRRRAADSGMMSSGMSGRAAAGVVVILAGGCSGVVVVMVVVVSRVGADRGAG